MSKQLVGLRRWLMQREAPTQSPRLLLWPVDRSIEPSQAGRRLEAALRKLGADVRLEVVGPMVQRDPASAVGSHDPFGAACLQYATAVILVASTRRSSVLHAYRIFKELVALTRRPRYFLALSGRTLGLQSELFGRRVRDLASRHTGVAWHLLGTLGDGKSPGELGGFPILEELVLRREEGGQVEVD